MGSRIELRKLKSLGRNVAKQAAIASDKNGGVLPAWH